MRVDATRLATEQAGGFQGRNEARSKKVYLPIFSFISCRPSTQAGTLGRDVLYYSKPFDSIFVPGDRVPRSLVVQAMELVSGLSFASLKQRMYRRVRTGVSVLYRDQRGRSSTLPSVTSNPDLLCLEASFLMSSLSHPAQLAFHAPAAASWAPRPRWAG